MPPPPPSDRSPIIRIDRDTLVPIGLLVSVVMSAVGAVWWISSTIHELTQQQREAWFVQQTAMLELKGQLDVLKSELRLVASQVQDGSSDRWRFADMVAWAKLLAAQNPTLTIPQPSRGQ
jgi:hypothetical protein